MKFRQFVKIFLIYSFFSMSPRDIYATIIISEGYILYEGVPLIKFPKAIQDVFQQIVQHEKTCLLLNAIGFQIKKTTKSNYPIIIEFESNDEAMLYGNFSTVYTPYKISDKNYGLKVLYAKNCRCEKFFRMISFFKEGRYRQSLLEVPVYICFAHELCHILNVLEFLNSNSPDVRSFWETLNTETNDINTKQNINFLKKFLEQKNHFSIDLLSISERELFDKFWGEVTGFDDFCVILGNRREIAAGKFENLGETIFMKEFYSTCSLNFLCWSHLFATNNTLENLNTLVEYSGSSYSNKQIFTLLNFWGIQETIVPIEAQNFSVDLVSCSLDRDKKIFVTKAYSFCYETGAKVSHQPTAKKYFNVGALLNPKQTFLYCPAKSYLYSTFLKIADTYSPSNTEKIEVVGKPDSVFFLDAIGKCKAGDTVTLHFRPFIPPAETEVVIEGARVQLKNVVADGNCGVWALAQALRSEQNFIKPTFLQVKDMERLRARAATFVHNNSTIGTRIAMSAFCANDLDHWLYTDDFRYFAQAIGRPIGIIVYGDGYRIYEPNGNEIVYDNMPRFRMYLNQHPETLTICLIGNHYQTVTSIKDLLLLTSTEK